MTPEPVCTHEDHELFGITLFRQAVAAWQEAVTDALFEVTDPVTISQSISLTRELKRLVKLTAQWFEQHIYDNSGSYETTLRFLDCVYGDLMNEGRDDFIQHTDRERSWANPATYALWTAGVAWVYQQVMRIIRDDDTRLEKPVAVPVNA